MNKLKKWVLFPMAVFVVAIALLVLLMVLSVQVGFLWSLVIVFVPVIASVVALKKAGGKSYLREKTFLRLIIPVDEVSDPSTVKIQEIVGVAILVVLAGWLMVSTFSDSVEISKTTAPKTHVVTAEEKVIAKQKLTEYMNLAETAGLVTSYEFSDSARVVYIGDVWYTQSVTFKKDFLGAVALQVQPLTGYSRFEVRDSFSNQKVAEVTAFKSLEVYR